MRTATKGNAYADLYYQYFSAWRLEYRAVGRRRGMLADSLAVSRSCVASENGSGEITALDHPMYRKVC
jgi:hypothetical protein